MPTMLLELRVNGEARRVEIDPRVSLLDLLREHLGLTGTKVGCNHGQCGACTVLVNGERVNACLSLALLHEGDSVQTIEGLADAGELTPVQQAFLDHDAFQCGYCTPGQILSATALLDEVRRGEPSVATRDLAGPVELNEAEIRERMSGNLCRCAAYVGIVEAVKQAAVEQGLQLAAGTTREKEAGVAALEAMSR